MYFASAMRIGNAASGAMTIKTSIRSIKKPPSRRQIPTKRDVSTPVIRCGKSATNKTIKSATNMLPKDDDAATTQSALTQLDDAPMPRSDSDALTANEPTTTTNTRNLFMAGIWFLTPCMRGVFRARREALSGKNVPLHALVGRHLQFETLAM